MVRMMCSRRCLKSEIWYELTNIFFVHLTAASGVSPCRLLVAASDIGVAIFGSRFTAWLGNHVQPHMGALLLTGGDAKKEMDFRGITFCRCGIADKTFPGETAKRRFILWAGAVHSPAGVFSQLLMAQNCTWNITASPYLRLYFFFLSLTCGEKWW